MSDEDSWSGGGSDSGGSSSDASSSSGEGGGWSWSEAASEAAGQALGSLFEPSTAVPPQSVPPASPEAPLLNPAIMALFTAGAAGAAREARPAIDARTLAEVQALETALEQPAPDQLGALLDGRWYVQRRTKRRQRRFEPTTWGFDRVIRICTHPDGPYDDGPPVEVMDGRTLFPLLAAEDGVDGVAVSLGPSGDYSRESVYLGPDILRGLVAGEDRRIGAAPLPARTRAEIELWMEITQFPWRDREIVPVDGAPGVVQARSSMDSTWRPYETGAGAATRPGPTLGPLFTISQPDARPGDLGDGRTEILCGGLLAEYLYEKATWHPPTWFISRETRRAAARLAMIAAELQKLIPDGADELPRSAILTVAGASFWRRHPGYRTRRWMQTIHERYHRAATHWLPSLL